MNSESIAPTSQAVASPTYVSSSSPLAYASLHDQDVSQPTQEQLYQYHLFINGQRPNSPPLSPGPQGSKQSCEESSAIAETVIAIIGMIVMVVVGVLGYQQAQFDRSHGQLPNMSGFVVVMATIPIAVTVLLLLIKLAIWRTRLHNAREGQIVLLDDIDLEAQGRERADACMMASFWPRGQETDAPPLVDNDEPPAYEERAIQTVQS